YSAFVLQHIDYIIETTVPAQQNDLSYDELLQWATTTQWQGLDVCHHQKLGKIHAQVEFKAYFKDEQSIQTHHELSAFVLSNTRWYFIDPTVPVRLTMKQPCFCGSQLKFKHCCGQFLK
ncbi:MAG: YchJ family protein, partial [Acinetobacter sp.]|nr:YchJ family protein [Acinetobacter sp.]